LIKVAKELIFFLVFHFFIGYRIIDILSEISFMEKSVVPSSYVVASLWSALDVLLICIVVNTLATFSLIMLRTILCINFTKRLRFDVASGQKSIIQGMTSKIDLLKHLAFYDFSLMTNESKWRRNDFFALSQPGGHPHNWKGLKKACLDQIQDFIQQLLDSSQAAQPSENKNSAGVTTAEIPKSQPVLYSAGRNLAISEVTKTNVQPIHQISNNNNKTGESKDILSKIPLGGNYLVKILKSIKEKCSNNALINASPDAGVRAVFAKSQVVIWAVEGLSHLISFSISEDRYGVVQKDLSEVISILFALEKTINKHKGVTITSRKNRFETRDQQLKQELRTSLKSSIYRIVNAYGDHLDSISIPTEWHKKLHSYKTFHE